MPESPPDISKYYDDKAAILNQTAHVILTEIFNWIKYSNKPSSHVEGRFVQISADTLLQDLAYIEKANALVFEQRDFDRFAPLKDNSSVTGKVVANYTAFNKLLQTMLQPNDYVNGRPDASSTIATLAKIQESYMANIKTLYRNRLLLV